MKILVVAATEAEVKQVLESFSLSKVEEGLVISSNKTLQIDFLITGIGMVNTAYYLGKFLNSTYQYVINAGLAGSFDKNIPIGEVVEVVEDTFSELGAENDEQLLTLNEIGLEGQQKIENRKHTIQNNTIAQLRKTKAITVNTVHGNEASIAKVQAIFQPQIESMEGAAFMFACEKEKVPYAQLRAISNYVEKRNKDKWNIPLAVKNLNEKVIEILSTF